VLGMDAAGSVDEVGDGVTMGGQVRDTVMCMPSRPVWAWHSALSQRERAGGEGPWPVRQTWAALTLSRREGPPLMRRPSADVVAGNGRPLSWAPSADAVAERGHKSMAKRALWFCTRCPFHICTASPCGRASFPRKRESRRRGA
jgi:hypothetical protein